MGGEMCNCTCTGTWCRDEKNESSFYHQSIAKPIPRNSIKKNDSEE